MSVSLPSPAASGFLPNPKRFPETSKQPYPEHAIENARRDQSRRDVVHHDSKATRQSLERRHWPGFPDIEQPEQKEGHQEWPPIVSTCGQPYENKREPLACNLVEHAFGRIVEPHFARMAAAGPHADD